MLAIIVALAAGIGIDLLVGDPPNRYHPVAWLGKSIAWIIPHAKGHNEKVRGILLACAVVASTALAAYLLALASVELAGTVGLVIMSALLLKTVVAIKGMERYAMAIMLCLGNRDILGARRTLSLIVRRETEGLDEQHIISATIECIGESTVDGIVGPIFYYSLFGPAGAFGYRAINTLDSMVGYRDQYYRNIGWMSARLDTIANYLPARFTALLMVVSARIIGADWKGSLQTLQHDHVNTLSPNAGYPMASMAGALRVRLEKIGHYSLGEAHEPISIEKCKMAVSIMKLTTLLLCLVYSVPAILALYFAGWWRILFGIP